MASGAPAGTQISTVVNNNDGSSLVYAYDPTNTVKQTAERWSATNAANGAPAGSRQSNVINNTDGTTLVYAYNPSASVTQTTTKFSGTDPTNGASAGSQVSAVVDNVRGGAIVYAFNPTPSVLLTASFYPAYDAATGAPLGVKGSDLLNYVSGQSSITSYGANGISFTVYYSGADGTGAIIPALVVFSGAGSALIAPDVIVISGADRVAGPGVGDHRIQFAAGAVDDSGAPLLASAGGFDTLAGDRMDAHALFAAAGADVTAAVFRIDRFVSGANRDGTTEVPFDPMGWGGKAVPVAALTVDLAGDQAVVAPLATAWTVA